MTQRLGSLSGKELLHALERAGYYIHHQTGSHAQLKHRKDPLKRITVPIHAKELPRGTLIKIIKQTEMTIEEFKRYL